MLKRSWLLLAFSISFCFCVFAQEETTTEKKSNHYIGIQANQLVRQIFNFGGGNSAVTNPYFLTYAVNSIESGVGLNLGIGYTYSQTDDGDTFVDRTTTVNDLFFRVGIEWKSEIAPKTIFSIGGDVVSDILKTSTETGENSQGQSNFESGTKTTGIGLGPRLTLNYALTDKIIIGTEANWYFKRLAVNDYEKIDFFETVFDPTTGRQRQVRRSDETKNEKVQKRFQFNAPAVIFIILKF